MEFEDVVKGRRSVRNYDTSKEVSNEQLKELFELVKLSPSSHNLQPGEFVVVRSREKKMFLKECANNQQQIGDASAVIIVLGTKSPAARAESIAADRIKKGMMDEEKKKRFLAAVKSISEDEDAAKLWTVCSTSLSAMTLMLAAKNMGLDTCVIGSCDTELVKKEFSIPENYEIVMMITLGYSKSKEQPERPMRYGYEDIVHLEKFGQK